MIVLITYWLFLTKLSLGRLSIIGHGESLKVNLYFLIRYCLFSPDRSDEPTFSITCDFLQNYKPLTLDKAQSLEHTS